MIKLKKGSSIILVMIITTFLSLLLYGFWHKTSFLFDLVVQREKFYKNYYLTETALNYGMQYAKNNYDTFLSKDFLFKLPITLNVDFLKSQAEWAQNLSLKLFIDRVKINKIFEKKLWLTSFLQNNEKVLCKLSCKLKKEVIQNENSENVTTKFICEGFTISNFV